MKKQASKPTPSLEFKKGELVVLKSGGPVMTVQRENLHPTTARLIGYHCQWFAGKKLESGSFPTESLEYPPNEKP